MLGTASERLRYLSPSVQSLIRTLAAQYPKLTFLTRCRVQLDTGASFESAFRAAVLESELSVREKEILAPLAAELGRTGLESQLASLAYAMSRLEEYSQQEKAYLQTHGKLYRALGVLGGIALAIVLL